MNNALTFAERVILFDKKISGVNLDLPQGFQAINPFSGSQKDQIFQSVTSFYHKYYNDNKKRRIILGSSPARRRSAVSGIPFVDSVELNKVLEDSQEFLSLKNSSSGFWGDVIRTYGGYDLFYTAFYLNFVCPIGIVRTKSDGTTVNCNYYENGELREVLYPFIVDSLKSQLNFGIDMSVCYCIGSGQNFQFLLDINNQYGFFETIIPLEHPRYIMQYHSKNKAYYMDKYLKTLKGSRYDC